MRIPTLAFLSLIVATALALPTAAQEPAPTLPRRVFYPGLAFDSVRRTTMLLGGLGDDRSYPGTWEWNGSVWRMLRCTVPPSRSGHGMVFDSRRSRVVVFGGFAPNDQRLGDTWEHDGIEWRQRSSTGPAARGALGMAYDSARGRVVMFGGSAGVGQPAFSDTWEWDGTTWTQVATTGPSGNSFHKMAYDAARERVVSFGGRRGGDDTWTWDGRIWVKVADSGPPPRDHHAIAYDSRRGRVMVFGGSLNIADGGYPPQPTFLRDLWEWDGRVWTEVSADGPPSGGGLPGLAYDDVRGRLVLFGGGNLEGTWEWDGTRWERKD